MFSRSFHPRQFLRSVYGTEPLVDYCRTRGIAFDQVVGFTMREEDYRRWQEALRKLPQSEQARIELELAQVNEMAHPESITHLIEVVGVRSLSPDTLPGGAPLALWLFLQHPSLFHDVFLHREIEEADSWRIAHAPAGIVLSDLSKKQTALEESLKEFFQVAEGTGRYCAVESYQLRETIGFVAYLSDRLCLFQVFTEGGKHRTQAARPAFAVLFLYDPRDGRVLLKTRRRSQKKILDLFQRFGRSVLGVELTEHALAPAFRLDLLKRRFDPPTDFPGIKSVRVKSLLFGYSERDSRRRLKLETRAEDSQFAILDLLRKHVDRDTLDRLTVLFAELQLQLQEPGQPKNYPVKLWPDRCSLGRTPLDERLLSCLKRWGLLHADRP